MATLIIPLLLKTLNHLLMKMKKMEIIINKLINKYKIKKIKTTLLHAINI